MTSLKKLAMLSLAVTVLTIGSVSAKSHSSKSEKHRSSKQDKLVGAWNIVVPAMTPGFKDVQGIVIYNADGTTSSNSTSGLGQPQPNPNLPPSIECGSYSTGGFGCWKRICKNKYKSVTSFVIVAPAVDSAVCSSFGLPANDPAVRLRSTSHFTLSKDGKTITYESIKAEVFDVNDICFEGPSQEIADVQGSACKICPDACKRSRK